MNFGGVWEFLQTQNPDRYHDFLYELLGDTRLLASDALILLLKEIRRLEPGQSKIIDLVEQIVNLLDELDFVIDVRDCLQLPEISPFSFTPKKDKILELVRHHATKENLQIWIKVCQTVSISSQECVKEYILEQLQDQASR